VMMLPWPYIIIQTGVWLTRRCVLRILVGLVSVGCRSSVLIETGVFVIARGVGSFCWLCCSWWTRAVAVSRIPVVCGDAALALHYYPDWRVVDSSLCSLHFSRFSFSFWLPKLRFDRDGRFCNRTRRW
jgi:hypothetical protein